MKRMWVVVVGIMLIFPGMMRAEDEEWVKLEQEMNIQLEQLDADMQLMEEQLVISEEAEVSAESSYVEINGRMEQILSEKTVVANLLVSGVITTLDVTKGNQAVNLAENDGEMVYRIAGIREEKLVGIWPVKIKTMVTVLARTGELLNQEYQLGMRILNWISV